MCSAHPLVLEAALRVAVRTGGLALIEATSNQVNQDGGYTGMRPADFRELVLGHARRASACRTTAWCWAAITSARIAGSACRRQLRWHKAAVMVAEYVAAGFRKIHLDCSMSCADDPRSLGDELIAERTATPVRDRRGGVAQRRRRAAGLRHRHRSAGAGRGARRRWRSSRSRPRRRRAPRSRPIAAPSRATGSRRPGRASSALVVQPGVEFDHHQRHRLRAREGVALSRASSRCPAWCSRRIRPTTRRRPRSRRWCGITSPSSRSGRA